MTEAVERLKRAALAVCDRWDSPDWKDPRHTGDFIRELRGAAAALEGEPPAWPDREAVAVLLSLVTDAADDLSDTLGARNQEGGGGASADERNRLATLNRIAAMLSASDGAGTEGGAR